MWLTGQERGHQPPGRGGPPPLLTTRIRAARCVWMLTVSLCHWKRLRKQSQVLRSTVARGTGVTGNKSPASEHLGGPCRHRGAGLEVGPVGRRAERARTPRSPVLYSIPLVNVVVELELRRQAVEVAEARRLEREPQPRFRRRLVLAAARRGRSAVVAVFLPSPELDE